jgi:hypothetical protein
MLSPSWSTSASVPNKLVKAHPSSKTQQVHTMQLSRSQTDVQAGLQADSPKEPLVQQLPSAGYLSHPHPSHRCLPSSPFEQHAWFSLRSVGNQQQRPTAVSYAQSAAELAPHGYHFTGVFPDQLQYGGSRTLQVRCSRTNRLRTLLQLPRGQIQQLDGTQHQQLLSELQLACSLHHPHTVKVQEVFLGPLHLNIVVEECSAGRLLDYAAKQQAWAMQTAGYSTADMPPALSLERARWLFQQLVLAVQYCHAKGFTGLAIEHVMLKVRQADVCASLSYPQLLTMLCVAAAAQVVGCVYVPASCLLERHSTKVT